MTLRVSTCQIRAVLSSLPDTRWLPSGAKARQRTAALWPLKSRSCFPVAVSQRVIVLPFPVAAICFPSDEMAAQKVSTFNQGKTFERRVFSLGLEHANSRSRFPVAKSHNPKELSG